MKNPIKSTITLLLNYLFPSIKDAFFVATLLASSIQGHMMLNADGEQWHHITIGTYIAENCTIPTTDIFSHTMYGEILVPHEWLSQLIFSRVHFFAGLNGIVLLISLIIATAFTLTYHQLRKNGTFHLVALMVTTLAAFASSLHWLARPHVVTFLFVAIWTYSLADKKSKLWYFPLIMLVWTNTHGAFIVGFAIWLAHITGWIWDFAHNTTDKATGIRLSIIGASSFVVTLINPTGWNLWKTSVGYYGNQFLVNRTVEYLSPNFHNWSTWPFLIMLAICLFGLSTSIKLKTYETFLLIGWTILSLYSARNIPIFAIVIAPYVAAIIQALVSSSSILNRIDTAIDSVEKNHIGILIPVLAVSVLVTTSIAQKESFSANTFDPDKFPVRAVDWLDSNPQEGKMFNNFIWGGYLLYRTFPEYPVFIDGQTDFYGEGLSREYSQVTRLESGWQDILDKYDVSWVIIQSGHPLIQALENELSWEIVYQDNTATIIHNP